MSSIDGSFPGFTSDSISAVPPGNGFSLQAEQVATAVGALAQSSPPFSAGGANGSVFSRLLSVAPNPNSSPLWEGISSGGAGDLLSPPVVVNQDETFPFIETGWELHQAQDNSELPSTRSLLASPPPTSLIRLDPDDFLSRDYHPVGSVPAAVSEPAQKAPKRTFTRMGAQTESASSPSKSPPSSALLTGYRHQPSKKKSKGLSDAKKSSDKSTGSSAQVERDNSSPVLSNTEEKCEQKARGLKPSLKIPEKDIYQVRCFYRKYLQKLFPKDTPVGYYGRSDSNKKHEGLVQTIKLNGQGDPTFTIMRSTRSKQIDAVVCNPDGIALGCAPLKQGNTALVWHKRGYVLARVSSLDRKNYYFVTLDFSDLPLRINKISLHDVRTRAPFGDFLPGFCRVISAEKINLAELPSVQMDLFGNGLGTVYCAEIASTSSSSSSGQGAGSFQL